MTSKVNHYSTLHLSQNASMQQICDAYTALLSQKHSYETTLRIHEAYSTLGKRELKDKYDAKGIDIPRRKSSIVDNQSWSFINKQSLNELHRAIMQEQDEFVLCDVASSYKKSSFHIGEPQEPQEPQEPESNSSEGSFFEMDEDYHSTDNSNYFIR